MRMQAKMAEMVKSPGHVPFNKFRGFRSGVRDMGEEGPVRFVDGELVEAFLDLGVEAQERVVEGLEVGVEEVRGIVEGLKRIH
jgi:DNA damage-binding protein 1